MIENSDLISIIIPVFNGEKYLPNCLQALADQTYDNYEIIFGYDVKSTDKSREILREFQKNQAGKHTVIIDEGKDNGPGGGRNRSIKHAKGTYIVFVDADDIVMPHYLEYLHDTFIQHPEASISCCRCMMLLPGEDVRNVMDVADSTSEHSTGVADKKEMIASFLGMSLFDYQSNGIISSPAAWLYMIKKDFLLSHHITYFDAKVTRGGVIEDVVVVLKLLLSGDIFAYTDKILYLYNIHEGSIIFVADQSAFLESLKATCDVLEKDLDAVCPDFSQKLYHLFLPGILMRSTFTQTYEEWSGALNEAFNTKYHRLTTETLIPANPESELNNLIVEVFNTDKHWFYVLARHYWYNILSRLWKVYPVTDREFPLDSEKEKEIARELENIYPQFLKKTHAR